MITADYDRFVIAMTTYAKIYSKKLDDEQLKAYWELLKDRDIGDIERRLLEHSRKAKFFPKPRDLRPIEPDRERIEADPIRDSQFAAKARESGRCWDHTIAEIGVIGKLLACAALKARYEVLDEGNTLYGEKHEWLKDRVSVLLREADPRLVLHSVGARRLVLEYFGDAGLRRLEEQATESAEVLDARYALQSEPELL